MFALADVNSFYASCERFFRPDLKGQPVFKASNNDATTHVSTGLEQSLSGDKDKMAEVGRHALLYLSGKPERRTLLNR